MSRSINLMPSEYRQRLGDSRLRRRFAGYGLATAVVIAGLVIHSRLGVGRMKALAQSLAAQAAQLEAVRAEGLEINRKADAAAERLADYYRLALPIEISDVLALVSHEMPAGLYLTDLDLNVSQRAEATSAMEELRQRVNRSKGRKVDERNLLRFLTVTLTGVGQDGVQVAQFIGRLESHAVFDRVILDFDRTRTIGESAAREFRVRFEVDLERRFVLGEGGATRVGEDGPPRQRASTAPTSDERSAGR